MLENQWEKLAVCARRPGVFGCVLGSGSLVLPNLLVVGVEDDATKRYTV